MAQELTLKRGQINENLALPDSVGSRLSVYLPTDFDMEAKWPLFFVVNLQGGPDQPLEYFVKAAEQRNFVLATTSALLDSVNLTTKVVYLAKSLKKLEEILPLDPKRVYMGGIRGGGKLASILPSMLPNIRGILAVASGPPNGELLSSKNRFDYVGLMNRADQHYLPMLQAEATLSSKGIPAHVLYFEDTQDSLPDGALVERGMALFDLMGMTSGTMPMDSTFVEEQYRTYIGETSKYFSRGHYLLAEDRTDEAIDIFKRLRPVDTLKAIGKQIRRTEGYKREKRTARTLSLMERLIREDFDFYLEEDVLSFNLNNLGWWKNKMESIENYQKSWKQEEALMGYRLQSYLMALTDDFLRIARVQRPPDEDALILLYMLRTIIEPEVPDAYLRVISLTSKYGDQGTALFYLEELLKTGYKDKDRLYSLEHTGLLRITKEFNALIGEYLEDPRYEIPELPDRGF